MKDKYLQYSIEDWVIDPDFQDYVVNGENAALWKTWLENNPGTKSMVESATVYLNQVNFKTYEMSAEKKDALWQKIDQKTVVSSSKVPIIKWISRASAIAAILILGWTFLGPDGLNEVYAPPTQQTVFSLPESSVVKLNADSRVQYNKDRFNKERKLSLDGEAFFSVEKGSSFTVDLKGATVQVLGTSFNIYNRGDSVSVQCYTGRVRVAQGEEEVILTQGEWVGFKTGSTGWEEESFTVSGNEPLWVDGVFTYQDASLSVVLEELARQYDVQIVYGNPSIRRKLYTGGFRKSDSLETSLNSICWPLRLTFDHSEKEKEVFIKE